MGAHRGRRNLGRFLHSQLEAAGEARRRRLARRRASAAAGGGGPPAAAGGRWGAHGRQARAAATVAAAHPKDKRSDDGTVELAVEVDLQVMQLTLRRRTRRRCPR